MRLHTLTATAFGPFPETVEVDFDRVCAAGLFLIHGATGAGKTSLLDAICFALFADVPGSRTRRGLASDHAVEGTRPWVRLDFTAGGRRLRVERSPEFSRPKKRGTGQTRVPAGVTLEEWRGGGWRAVSTRHDEVADVIDEALGMGLSQFVKVVVLPQGDVSAFLRATPEDRRTLLERLFDISTFTGVEGWLTEERRRCAAEADGLALAIRRDLDRLHDHLGGGASADWDSVPVETLPAALTERVSALEGEVLTLLTAAEDASHALADAGAALHSARTRAETRRRGLRALADRDAALACADEIAALRVVTRRALAADALSGHLAALETARGEEQSCRAELRAARAAAGLVPDGSSVRQGKGHPTDSRVARLSDLLRGGDAVVAELVRTAREQALAQAALSGARDAVADCEESLAAALSERAAVERDLAVAQCTVAELELSAAGHDAAESASAAATRDRWIATEIEQLTRTGAADLSALISARDDVLTAQESVMAARQRRLDGMAAELATALGEGAPCPVCGSAAHPSPAVARHLVGPEEIESAEESLTQARSTLAGHERREAARASRVATLLEQLGDAAGTDLAGLARVEAAAADALAATSAARSALPSARQLAATAGAGLQAATARAGETSQALAGTRATLAAALEHHDSLVASLALLRARHAGCPCTGDDDGALPVVQVHRAHTTMRAAVDQVQAAGTRHVDAMDRLRDQQDAALAAARQRGFIDLEEARSACLEVAVVDRAQARIADHEQTLAIAAAVLAEESVAAAVAGPGPDVEAAADEERAARRLVRQTQSAHSAAESRLTVLRSVHGPVCDLVTRLVLARDRAATVKDLADAATGVGGGNLYRMRLSSFVLAARLEKVVGLANERLQRMDAGRYLLEHSDARVSGGARSGLDLRVLDQWTGRTRETASLSGGESFMVSLALALGLADAVREEAGGFDLGTLFVDEGFGSLDEESLEQVMGVLDALREGGRAVGVVSHVPDLRGRISHQVVVEKTATGSAVTVRTVA